MNGAAMVAGTLVVGAVAAVAARMGGIKAFVGGMAAAWCVAGVLLIARMVSVRFGTRGVLGPLPAWVTLWVVAALEECGKAVALSRTATNNGRNPHRSITGSSVAIGAAVGLAFAAAENLFFVLNPLRALLVRTITTVPLHAATGALLGTAFSTTRESRQPLIHQLRAVGTFCAAVIIHAAYNLLLTRTT